MSLTDKVKENEYIEVKSLEEAFAAIQPNTQSKPVENVSYDTKEVYVNPIIYDTKQNPRTCFDRRWDDFPDDHDIWEPLLRMCRDHYMELFAALVYIRAMGGQLQSITTKEGDNTYKIVPFIDPEGKLGFVSEDEFKREAGRVFQGQTDNLRKALRATREVKGKCE